MKVSQLKPCAAHRLALKSLPTMPAEAATGAQGKLMREIYGCSECHLEPVAPAPPDVPAMLPFAVVVLVRSAVGCCHHVWLSDPNDYPTPPSHVDPQHKDCLALARVAQRASPTQVRKLRYLAWECYGAIEYPERFGPYGERLP